MNSFQSIPTYVINLKKRIDRKNHILREFEGRNEFVINIVEANEHKIGAVGLWSTIVQILNSLSCTNLDYIIICEDDHKFTSEYSSNYLFESIKSSQSKGADVLVGGVSWFENIVPLSQSLYWMEEFTGLQFTVIFKKFFQSITTAKFLNSDAADKKISQLSSSKMLIYPYISIQKDFGYSDATKNNEVSGRIDDLFRSSSEKIELINKVIRHYNLNPVKVEDLGFGDYDQLKVPTYIINLPERTDRLEHIRKEFEGRNEFEVTIIPACHHDIGAVGLWHSIRKIITLAVENDDDVIIICEDDHQFTEAYSKSNFMRNIIEAYYQGADVLSGGIGYFTQMIPLTEERFWIDSFWSTQFIVLYKKCFNQILSEEFDDSVTADDFLSIITSNKMVIYPFISTQKNFGYSDICKRSIARDIPNIFERCSNRISGIIQTYTKYALHTNKLSTK